MRIRYLLINLDNNPSTDISTVGTLETVEDLHGLKERIIVQEKLAKVAPRHMTLWRLKQVSSDSKVGAVKDKIKDIDFFTISHDDPPNFLEHLSSATTVKDFNYQHDNLLLIHVSLSAPLQTITSTVPVSKKVSLKPPNAKVDEWCEIFIHVTKWDVLQRNDLSRNNITKAEQLPKFVTTFNDMLDRKPNPDYIRRELSTLASTLGDYLTDGSQGTTKTKSPEARPDGWKLIHLALLAKHPWESLWKDSEFKASSGPSTMFDLFYFYPRNDSTCIVTRNMSPWNLSVIMKCSNEFRRWQPTSDLLISKPLLPRLFIQLKSKETNQAWPEDIWMLLLGAAVVRFSNKTCKKFIVKQNFIIVAMLFGDDGEVTSYTLFQSKSQVQYHKRTFHMNKAKDRFQVAVQLYNLLEDTECDQDEGTKIEELRNVCREHIKRSFHPGDPPSKSNNPTRTHTNANDGNNLGAALGSAREHAILKERGYEVEPHVIEKFPHIFTVHQASNWNKNETLIAKKVREESNELEILNFLDTIRPMSKHVISLVDSFRTESTSWVILPKLSAVADYLDSTPHKPSDEVTQLCYGLIDGLAYLHEHRIAHRDIKPDNLVVDANLCMKIIDFDIAIKVEDENEEVHDRCGTDHWIAPEVEGLSMYSPIKADRWSCGHVLQHFLSKLRERDESFIAITEKLKAQDPNERPSLLRLRDSVATMSLGVADASRRTAQPQPRRRKKLRPIANPGAKNAALYASIQRQLMT